LTNEPRPASIWERWSDLQLLLWTLALIAAYFIAQLVAFWLVPQMLLAVAAGGLLGVVLPCALLARATGGSLATEFGLGRVTPIQVVWAVVVAAAGLLPTSLLADLSLRIHPIPQEWLSFYFEHLPQGPAEVALGAMSVVVVAPLAEEILFRGLVHRLVRRLWGATGATMIASLAFAILHLEPWYLLALFGLGVLLSLIYEATGSLTPCVITHGAHNGISYFLLLGNNQLASGSTGFRTLDIWLMAGSLLMLVVAITSLGRGGE
jgi:membrane protease YdiL (CAAX protease family)